MTDGAARRSRGRDGRTPFALAIGLVVGILLTGLVVPFVRTETETTETAAPAGAVSGPQRTAAGEVTDPTTGDALADPTATAGGGTSGGGAGGGGEVAGGDGGGEVAGDAGGGAAPAGVTGTDAGVSDGEVKIGIALLDIGIAKDFGMNFDIGNQRARWDALIAHQNAQGGINGRQIVADYRTFNAAKPVETQQAACVGWTKDAQVFSVLVHSQLTQAAAVCLIGEGATPVFTTDGIDQSYYGNGMLFTLQANDNRILADHARYLHDKGVLKGRSIGIMSGEGAERLAVDNTLVPALQQYGYTVKAIEVVPGDTSGTQKLPIAVSNMKAAGVDYVIIAANVVLAAPFVQAADRAGFRPQYSLSDFNNQINDQAAGNYPPSFDGTVGLSTHRFPEYRAGLPQPPADKACMDRIGQADPKALDYRSAAFEVAMGECTLFDVWAQAAIRAGEHLNRPNLIAAAEQMGTFGIAGTLDGSFGPGKHDAVDFEREVVWRKDCKCWRILGDPGALRRLES